MEINFPLFVSTPAVKSLGSQRCSQLETMFKIKDIDCLFLRLVAFDKFYIFILCVFLRFEVADNKENRAIKYY